MKRSVGVFLIVGIVLMASSVFAIKTFNMVEGTSITLDNGVCERINLEFDEGETKTITIQGKSFTVTYKGAKLIPYNYEGEDYSSFPFIKKGDRKDSEEEVELQSIFEYEGKEYSYISDAFQDKMDGFYFHLDDSAKTESERSSDKYSDKYLGVAHLRGDESGMTTDCVGLNNQEGWNHYVDEIKFSKGWNLVPREVYIQRCRGGASSIVCYDDFMNEPINYIFDPVGKKYYSEKWIEEYVDKKGNDYRSIYEEELGRKIEKAIKDNGYDIDSFSGEELRPEFDFLLEPLKEGDVFLSMMEFEDLYGGSQWIYLTEDQAGKSYMQNSYFKMDNSFGIALFEGWNLQYVYPDYVFKSNGEYELRPKSLNDLKGTCDITEAYFFDGAAQSWVKVGLDQKFGEDDLNKGLAIKVTKDCRIGRLREDAGAPPVIPTTP